MAQKKRIAAFFDFDGTLFSGHFWQGLADYHFKHNKKKASVYIFLVINLLMSFVCVPASKIKLIRPEFHKVKWGEDMGFFLKGMSAEEVEKIYQWMVSDYFLPRAKPETTEILKQHIEKGHLVAIVSGSYYNFLDIIGKKLGVGYVLGTEGELKNGVHTGRIIKPLCFGKHKADAIGSFMEREKLDIDLENSYAYADNVSDLPMLEMVGNPAAIYPDKKLLKTARQRGWRVVG